MKIKSSVILTVLVSGFIAFLPKVQAVVPPPDGGYAGGNTAEGQNALLSRTTGGFNAAIGWLSLRALTTASFNTGVGAGTLALNNADQNTAIGAGALLSNTSGLGNTATGAFALFSNNTGTVNTANGAGALLHNTIGSNNTASGANALFGNTSGDFNTATGFDALVNNTTGEKNTANGDGALFGNIDGAQNNAVGYQALLSHQTGSFNNAFGALALVGDTAGVGNTAIGDSALQNNSTGNSNTAIGSSAGFNATTGDGNVYVGAGMLGVAGENDHTYIRNINATSVSGGGTDTVTVNLTTGLLGHLSSSRRYKESIKAMENTSEAVYQLKPVTYRYKKEIDSTQSPAFGLIAEEVAKVSPDLVARNAEGQPESVHYEMVNAMLLNEFLKEHKAFLQEQSKVQKLEAALESVNERLKEQDTKIERVSAQLETNRPGPRTVVDNR
jgi:hypothetical protein